jgi:hypothetical protein
MHLVREAMLVGVPVPVGGLAYMVALHWLRVDEIAVLRQAVMGRIVGSRARRT